MSSHAWTLDDDVNDLRLKVDRFRNGNTRLLELLMKLHAGEHTTVLEAARDILANAELLNGDGTLNWQALEDRKLKQQTWAEAVEECLSDPAEKARLLALNDPEPTP